MDFMNSINKCFHQKIEHFSTNSQIHTQYSQGLLASHLISIPHLLLVSGRPVQGPKLVGSRQYIGPMHQLDAKKTKV